MLSARLVQIIEDHAEQLTRGLIDDLLSNNRTLHYHHLTREELHLLTCMGIENSSASWGDFSTRRYITQ